MTLRFNFLLVAGTVLIWTFALLNLHVHTAYCPSFKSFYFYENGEMGSIEVKVDYGNALIDFSLYEFNSITVFC